VPELLVENTGTVSDCELYQLNLNHVPRGPREAVTNPPTVTNAAALPFNWIVNGSSGIGKIYVLGLARKLNDVDSIVVVYTYN